jgi:hypothetical protein
MSQYQLHYSGKAIIEHLVSQDKDGQPLLSQRLIPIDPSNWAYNAYQNWLADGNVPDPADPAPAPNPQEVANNALYTDMKDKYQNTVSTLQGIEQDLTNIKGRADTLSTIAITGTLAQTQGQLQTILRALGTDLGTLSTDVKTLTQENEQLLKIVGTYISSALT